MKTKREEENLRYALLKLLCYMTTSARGCIEEPKLYGPFRLLDSVERLITLFDNEGLGDDFLREKRAKIEESKYLVMQDKDKFIEILDELVIDFARKLKESAIEMSSEEGGR